MRKEHKYISIIVPVYNSEKFLDRCITSILNQTQKGIELILINDGSKDNSQEIIHKYIKKYPDVIKTKTIKNSGPSVARNTGLEMATGDYVGFVDSDDYIDKTMYEKLYEKAINASADIIACDYFIETEKSIRTYQAGENIYYGENIIDSPQIFVSGVPYLWNKIFKRELIIKNKIYFNKDLKIFEDLTFVYKLYAHANKILKIDEPLYYYIKYNSESLTSKFTEKFFHIIPAIQELKEYYMKLGLYDELEEYLIYVALNHAYIRCNMKVSLKQIKIKLKYIKSFFDFMDKEFPKWKNHDLYFEYKKRDRKKYTSISYWTLKTLIRFPKFKKIKMIIRKLKKFNPIGYIYMKYYYKYALDEKTILIDSQHGNDINGSMFYLIKELSTNSKYKNYNIYLGVDKKRVNEFEKKLNFYNINKVNFVLTGTKKYMKLLATAKFLMTDTSFIANYVKKEGQIYLNTWHGTPLKTLGRATNKEYYNIPNLQKNFVVADYLLYPNEYTMNHMLEDYMLNNIVQGKVLLCGYPRNSIFLNNKRREKLRKELGLNNKEIIAYMPTWRGTLGNKKQNKYVETLLEYFNYIDKNLNDNQIMYVNLHPYLKDAINLEGYSKIFLFDRKYETYDFLNICDTLITDYSSVFFDFALTNKKIILFTYDEKEYLAERGLYIGLDELPFPKVYSVEALIKEINNKKEIKYKKFLNEFCRYDSLDVSKKLCEKIILGKKVDIKEVEISKNNKKNVLVLVKNFSNKNINKQIFELINNTDKYQFNYYIGYINRILRKYSYNLLRLPKEINFMGQLYSMCNISLFTKIIFALHNRLGLKINFNNKKYNRILNDELRRIYGDIKFDYVVVFGEEKELRIRLMSKFKNSFKILYNLNQKNINEYKKDFDIILTSDDINSFETLNDFIVKVK